MPAKPKDDDKQNPAVDAHKKDDAPAEPELKANPVNPARPQDPHPDDGQPKNITSTGDALPITEAPADAPKDDAPYGLNPLGNVVTPDPMLDPASQQPGESAEHYAARSGKPKPAAGVYDAAITRGEQTPEPPK